MPFHGRGQLFLHLLPRNRRTAALDRKDLLAHIFSFEVVAEHEAARALVEENEIARLGVLLHVAGDLPPRLLGGGGVIIMDCSHRNRGNRNGEKYAGLWE